MAPEFDYLVRLNGSPADAASLTADISRIEGAGPVFFEEGVDDSGEQLIFASFKLDNEAQAIFTRGAIKGTAYPTPVTVSMEHIPDDGSETSIRTLRLQIQDLKKQKEILDTPSKEPNDSQGDLWEGFHS